jgi:hypothetical protein
MSNMIVSFLFQLMLAANAQAPIPTDQTSAEDLVGKWVAIGYFHNDDWIQPEDPQIKITYEFREDGTDTLFWQRQGNTAFCERKGEWSVSNGILQDEVTWVNPKNGMDCGSDPDMQLGKVTQSEFWRNENQMFLKIPFAAEFLIYVWELEVTPEDPAPPLPLP